MSAFYSWGDAAGGKLSFTKCLSKKDADIVCTWTRTYKDEPEMPPGRPNAGASFYQDFEEAGTGHINIKKVHISIPVIRPADGSIVTNEEIKCTCLHEIGHALGIDIHSPDSSDMMCRFNNAFKVKPVLSKRDVHTIQRLYSSFD
jgi:predicted Zn-dependent protease